MKIIQRYAEDSDLATVVAQGMEDAGAHVIGVTFDGMHHKYGAIIPSAKFLVWAKFDDPLTVDDIDAAITSRETIYDNKLDEHQKEALS